MLRLKNTYFILRHGENIFQVKNKGLIYPKLDSPSIKLTQKGKKEVKEAAQKLKKIGVDFIYSSDIFRCWQTAEIVAKELKIKNINFDKRLRDINLGIFHGRTKEEFYDFVGRKNREFSKRPLDGESWGDVRKRMTNFLKEVDKKHKNKNILIVSHGDPLWLLEGAVKGFGKKELLKRLFVGKKYIKVGELRKIN